MIRNIFVRTHGREDEFVIFAVFLLKIGLHTNIMRDQHIHPFIELVIVVRPRSFGRGTLTGIAEVGASRTRVRVTRGIPSYHRNGGHGTLGKVLGAISIRLRMG